MQAHTEALSIETINEAEEEGMQQSQTHCSHFQKDNEKTLLLLNPKSL